MIRSGFSLFLVLNFAFMANTFAQDHDQTKEQAHKTEDHDQVHKKHVISASLNHTVIFSAVKNDENKTNIIHSPLTTNGVLDYTAILLLKILWLKEMRRVLKGQALRSITRPSSKEAHRFLPPLWLFTNLSVI